MTSPERIYGLVKAVDYVCQNAIDGDIVECGVWRGGSSIAVAQRLCEIGEIQRHLWLYDTFAGMPAPSEVDVSRSGASAITKFVQLRSEEHTSEIQSLMRISYAVFCLKKKNKTIDKHRIRTYINNI